MKSRNCARKSNMAKKDLTEKLRHWSREKMGIKPHRINGRNHARDIDSLLFRIATDTTRICKVVKKSRDHTNGLVKEVNGGKALSNS